MQLGWLIYCKRESALLVRERPKGGEGGKRV